MHQILVAACGIQFPDQGSNLDPLHGSTGSWKPPRKSFWFHPTGQHFQNAFEHAFAHQWRHSNGGYTRAHRFLKGVVVQFFNLYFHSFLKLICLEMGLLSLLPFYRRKAFQNLVLYIFLWCRNVLRLKQKDPLFVMKLKAYVDMIHQLIGN